MMGSDDARWQSVFPLRAVGYGLLILAIFDIVHILYPPDFTNPQWEFNVFGQLVERVPVPMIGLALIFLGRAYGRSLWEKRGVTLLSWLSLAFGIGFFALTVVGWRSFSRLEDQLTTAAEQQVKQRAASTLVIEQRVEVATLSQLEFLANQLNQRPEVAIVNDGEASLRAQILAEIEKDNRLADRQARRNLKNQTFNLRKNFIKWEAGDVVSGVIFIYIFATTGWARRNVRRR